MNRRRQISSESDVCAVQERIELNNCCFLLECAIVKQASNERDRRVYFRIIYFLVILNIKTVQLLSLNFSIIFRPKKNSFCMKNYCLQFHRSFNASPPSSHIKQDTINIIFYKNGFAAFGGWILKFSKQLASTFAPFRSSGLGPQRLSFSNVECWWRMANRFTWTGMGTTILLPLFADDPRLPMLWDVRPALTRFHFARRFWNQILIWEIQILVKNNEKISNIHLNFAEF